jgi:hypothetical protein
MTEPTSTPENQDLTAVPDPEGTSQHSAATGFFNRVRQNLNPKKTHQTKEEEIVVMDEDEDKDKEEDNGRT